MSSRAPDLLAISSGRLGTAERVAEWCAAVGAAGVRAVQLREKEAADRELELWGRIALRELPEETVLLINGRPDLALAVGAGGVHLPARGLPIGAVRRLLGPAAWIGRSTHRLEEVERAFEEGADYVTFGPVFATPSKARYGPPVGLEALASAADVGGPVVALGGITMENAERCVAAGARGIAGISLFHPSADLKRRVRELRGLLRDDPA
ncbi:MAG: thiamine phosphate synthase [Thermoanaerobaculia bacterium]|nr:thiamine phosphate synthase [Thermoanaerobaculia bacterium]